MQQIAKPALKRNLFILSEKINRTNSIIESVGIQAFRFFKKHVDIDAHDKILLKDSLGFKYKNSKSKTSRAIINLTSLNKNNLSELFQEFLVDNLLYDGKLIGRIDFENPAKEYYFKNKSYSLIHSITPKSKKNGYQKAILSSKKSIPLKLIKKKIELLGMLCYMGFEIISELELGTYLYFVAKKIAAPSQNPKPTSSPIIRLKRIGKDGKLITIYKIRTMYPYSEYLQSYTYNKNHIEPGGKFCDDKRVSRIGNFIRKYWIDELPMLINLIKGDVKLIGVRPLSQQYFSLYPNELQQLRIKFRPGLIPPYYADLPSSFDEIIDSERRYLISYQNNPLLTDLRYLIKSLFNIIFKFKRSK
jgi:lipopolysaccharide/colanic/teichoic acid biosynthesis glycosyltransferase